MEVFQSFLMTIVVVLCFGVAVVAGQNGLLSARCAARCLTEHKDRLKKSSDRNNHRKFMIDHCKHDTKCFECMKPCAVSEKHLIQQNCVADYCMKNEPECEKSCEFLYYINMYKVGVCPRAETAMGFESVCLASCGTDSDCAENTKCCPNLCGYVCRTPDYTGQNLPEIPSNLTNEERRNGRALRLSWILLSAHRMVQDLVLFVLEHRNTTSQRPVWDDNTPWTAVTVTESRQVLLKEIHAGHWYQFRIAAVTRAGTQGYTLPSLPFRSSRRVQRPLPPQNITEGVTTLRNGHVDVTIHWEPPKYSDIPVSKYTIAWNERLTRISPVLVRIPVLEKTIAGHIHDFKLTKLEPGKTYNITIEAVVQHGNRELRSNTAWKEITTYAPPNAKPEVNFYIQGLYGTLVDENSDNREQAYFVYCDIIRVEGLVVVNDMPYFDKGSLKAQLLWSVGTDIQGIVKSFMIYWRTQSCDQEFPEPEPYSATSDVSSFEVYDLQFECVYNIQVSAVTKSGVQCKPMVVKLRTPVCEKIRVKGNSLPPECPERVPQVPQSPKRVKPVIFKRNCSVDVKVTWKHPRSDLPIDSYLVTYEQTDNFKDHAVNKARTVYKQKPHKIKLGKVTSVLISALKEAEIYVIKVYAVSSAGIGEPAFIEILTPRILPCGSDKDPEPPDKYKKIEKATPKSLTVLNATQNSSTIEGSITTVSIATVSKFRTFIYRTSTKTSQGESHLDIYKTVAYLFWFLSKVISYS